MALLGRFRDGGAKRGEKYTRRFLAQRDKWREERDRLVAQADANGLIDLIVEMEQSEFCSWPLVFETGKAAASFGEQTMKAFLQRPLYPEHRFAFGLVLALLGTRGWPLVHEMVISTEWPDDVMTYLPALVYFSLFEGEKQAEAQALLEKVPYYFEVHFLHRWERKQEDPDWRAFVKETVELCNYIDQEELEDFEERARLALSISEWNRLSGKR